MLGHPPFKTEVYVLWGDTGTGKTHRIRRDFPSSFFFYSERDLETNLRYAYDRAAPYFVFDDVRQYVDCRSFNRVVASGMFAKVFITGISNPDMWWPGAYPDDLDKFDKSITRVWNTYNIAQVLPEWPPAIPSAFISVW